MKYIRQNDYPDVPFPTRTDTPEDEYGQHTTFASSGCGLASAIMVADRLLIEPAFGIEEALALCYECGANHGTGTDYKRYAPAFAEKMGLALTISEDPEELRRCLRTGGAAVIHCSNNQPGRTAVFTLKGHYITAIAEAEDGRIVILDPAYKPGKYDIPERAGKVDDRNAPFVLTPMQVLVEDSYGKRPNCFYLFRRK